MCPYWSRIEQLQYASLPFYLIKSLPLCTGVAVSLPGPNAGHQIGPARLQFPEQADGPEREQDHEHGGPCPV